MCGGAGGPAEEHGAYALMKCASDSRLVSVVLISLTGPLGHSVCIRRVLYGLINNQDKLLSKQISVVISSCAALGK